MSKSCNLVARGRAVAVVFALLLWSSLSAAGENAKVPSETRGFTPNNVYQVGEIDSVNLYNGDVIVRIPIGQEYPVGASLRYRFGLTYNSKIWEYEYTNIHEEDRREAHPEPRSNAGLGWVFSMGHLIVERVPNTTGPPIVEKLTYVTPDGGEFTFEGGGYAIGGQYLRLRTTENATSAFLIDFPNGETRSFDSDGNVRRIEDRFGNWVNIDIEEGAWNLPDPNGEPVAIDGFRWTITDSSQDAMNPVRTHVVYLEDVSSRYTDDRTPKNFDLRVVAVELAAFGGARPRYWFRYLDDQNIGYGGGAGGPDPKPCIKGPLLQSVSLPDATTYTANYKVITDEGRCSENILNDSAGVMSDLKLPTGGMIEWVHGDYFTNLPFCYSPTIWYEDGYQGVRSRIYRDRDNQEVSRWTYHPKVTPPTLTFEGKMCGSATEFGPLPLAEEFVNTVISPEGLVTKHYYSIWPKEAPFQKSPSRPVNGFISDHYGLPASPSRVRGGRHLSTEVFDCSGGCVDTGGQLTLPQWPIRRTYLSYEMMGLYGWNGEPRPFVSGERTESEIDAEGEGTKFVDTAYSLWDGYGQFLETTTTSNFTNVPQSRKTRLERVSSITASRWLLQMETGSYVTEGQGAELRLSESCWDTTTGFLNRRRIFRGLAGVVDLLTQYEPDALGNVRRESLFGVDPGFVTCSGPLANPELASVSSFRYGALESKQVEGLDYKNADFVIDPSTGVVKESRDASGRRVATYDYDIFGRLKGVLAPGAGQTRYDYFRSALKGEVIVRHFETPSSTESLSETRYHYDGLGRLVQEKRRMPGGWATINRDYDGAGRNVTVSVAEFEPNSDLTTPAERPVTRTSYDVLGRATEIVAPDGSKVSTKYTGDRERERRASVANILGNTATQGEYTTKERYDGFGRLVEVLEPLPEGETSTTYTYDFGNRLLSVENGQAARSFTYDRAGLLIADDLPERDPGTYSYDGAGRVLTKTIGSTVALLHDYDVAGRLISVTDTATGKLLKEFKFDDDEGVSENGLLLRQIRHNHFPDSKYVVTDRLRYEYEEGRLASKETEVERFDAGGTLLGATKTIQQYSYDAAGRPAAIQFPTCIGCTGFPFGARSLALHWTDGLLTGIDGAASDIQYGPAGAVTKVVHRAGADPLGVTDLYEQDVTGARPKRIRFTNVRDCSLVLVQPASKSIAKFASATFTVEVAPGATIQWYEGISGDVTTPITNATAATFSTPALSETTHYWARVTAAGGGCTENSLTVTATVCEAPIVQTPEATSATTVYRNVALTFSVDVIGTVTYQWFTRIGPNGTEEIISGSGPQVTYTPAATETDRQIVVRVTNACGTVVRVIAILNVIEDVQCVAGFDPVYTDIFPRNNTVMPNEATPYKAVLRLSASAEAAFHKRRYSFRWIVDGVLQQSSKLIWTEGDASDPVNGTTGPFRSDYTHRFIDQSILRLEAWVSCYKSATTPDNAPDAISKTVVKQSFGMLNGHCPIPDLSVTPTSVALTTGESVTLTAEVVYPDAIYQWYEGESGNTIKTAFQGETSQLVVNEPGTYWLRVSSPCGEHTDSPTITVSQGSCNPVRILRDPMGATIAAGTPVPLSVDAAGVPSPNYYLWYEAYNGPGIGNDIPIADTNGRTAITVAPLETTDYYVRAGNQITYKNDCSLVKSRMARIHVTSCSEITLTTQPQDALFRDTDTQVALSVQATSPAPLQYQWYMGESGDRSHPLDASIGNGPTLVLTWADHLQDPAANKFWVKISIVTAPGMPKRCAVDSRTVTLCRLPRVHNPLGTQFSNSIPQLRRDLHIGVTGDDLTYEWYEGDGNAAIPDTTHPLNSVSDTVTVYPIQTTKYWVKVRSACAPANEWIKHTTEVSVCPAFNDAGAVSAAKILVPSGTTTTLTVSVDRGDKIEWYKIVGTAAPVKFAEGTQLTVTTPAITETTKFFARAISGMCSKDSEQITISICPSPTIHWGAGLPTQVAKNTSFWLSTGLDPGETANFAWYTGNTAGDIANSTLVYSSSNAYQVAGLSATTTYWVRATDQNNGCYSDTSARAVNVCIPTIVTQPQSIIINANTSTTLTVVTDNLPGVTYQWYVGQPGDTANPLAGQTSSSLTISPAATTTYWVRAFGCPSPLSPVTRDSQAATVTICQTPSITTQPASSWQTTPPTTLTVTTTGTNLTYQWYRGLAGDTSTPLSSTTASLQVSPTQTTNYWVRISGQCGTPVNSNTAKISVKPTITTQPAGGPITKGTTRTLTVVAGGTELTYQWYQRPVSGSPILIAGATAASYTTPPVMADVTYYVRVYSGGNAYDNSQDATLSVCLPREIESANYQSGISGSLVALRAKDAVAGEIFEWYRGNVGDISAPLGGDTVKNVYPTVTTTYWLRTKRTGCDADSAPYTVNVCYAVINTQPEANSTIVSGTTKTLSVAVTGTAPLVYQWYRGAVGDTSAPVGTNSSSFTTPALTTSTSYWVRISTNAAACTGKYVNSAQATVTVCNPPNIVTHPAANILNKNTNFTLGVYATGDGLHYQWYIGESGDTSTPVGTDSPQISATATTTKKYWVRVTGTCGSANSAAALQSVIPIITAHPQTANVCGLGGTATFSVTATGADGYNWYRTTSGVQERVGTTPTLTIAVPNASATFKAVVTSGNASATSQTVGVTILAVPTVTGFTATQETTRWLLQTSVAAADQNLVRYKFYEGALGDTTTLLGDTNAYYKYVYPSSRPRTYWVAVYYTSSGCATNRAVTIP